jgi:hypothetical protein
MEELGLDPRSEFDCEVYAGHLDQLIEGEIEREIAQDEAGIAAQDIADQVVLDAIDRAGVAPPKEAERIVAEARRVADTYLADRLPARWRVTLAPCLMVRARRREPRTPPARRARIRSGSRGDPPPDPDDDPDPPSRAQARLLADPAERRLPHAARRAA